MISSTISRIQLCQVFFITMEYKKYTRRKYSAIFLNPIVQLRVFIHVHVPKCCFQVDITKSEFKANLSVCKIGIYFFAANADWLRNIFFSSIFWFEHFSIFSIFRVSIFLSGIFSGNVHVKSDKITAIWSAMDNDGFNLLPPYIITYVIN